MVGVGFGAFNSQQAQEVANKELKRQRAERIMRYGPEVGEGKRKYLPDLSVMDRAAANLILTRTQLGRTTNVGDVEFFLEHMDRRVGGESSDLETPAEALYNAQDMLAVERARFRADCAARAIRTAADAEKHMCRIAMARAEVVRQKNIIAAWDVALIFWWAGGTGGARRQPAADSLYYGIVAQGHWSAIAVIWH